MYHWYNQNLNYNTLLVRKCVWRFRQVLAMMVLVIRSEHPTRLRYPQVVTSTLLAVCIRQRPMFRQMPDVLCGPFCNSIHKTQLGRNVKCVNLRNSSCQHQMKRVSACVCKVGTFRYTVQTNETTILIALCYRHERLCDGPTKSECSSSDKRRMKHEEGESRLWSKCEWNWTTGKSSLKKAHRQKR